MILADGEGFAVTNFVTRNLIQQPSLAQLASDTSFRAPIEVNAWDGSSNHTNLPIFTMDKVVTITSVSDTTAGFLLISDEAAELAAVTEAGNISKVAIGSNTIQIDVTSGSIGTLADSGVADKVLNLFDLSGIELVENGQQAYMKNLDVVQMMYGWSKRCSSFQQSKSIFRYGWLCFKLPLLGNDPS